MLVDGMPLASFKGASPVQLIGQHPERTLDPLMCMRDALVEAGLEVSRGGGIDKGGAAFSEPAAAPFAVDPKLEAVSLANDPLLVALGIQHRWLTRFPHELSGGELQRFCIARALATNPRYLVADEISTMLDALTQAQLWKFLLGEVEARNMGLVFVSHSPALTARIATRIIDLTV